jgi:hypothetical protein
VAVLRVARSCGGGPGLVGGGERDEQPVLALGVEDGDTDAVCGEDVAVGVLEPADEPGHAQPPQAGGHLAGYVARVAEQPGHQDAKVEPVAASRPRHKAPKPVSVNPVAQRPRRGSRLPHPWPSLEAVTGRLRHASY